MKADVKAKWVEALRSGEYTQANGWLHVRVEGTDRHCVLGVLTDLAMKDGVPIHETPEAGARDKFAPFDYVTPDNGRWCAMLPPDVAEWAGFEDRYDGFGPRVPYKDRDISLSNLNDEGTPFEELANIIEREVPGA